MALRDLDHEARGDERDGPGRDEHVGVRREIEPGRAGGLIDGQGHGGIETADPDWEHDALYRDFVIIRPSRQRFSRYSLISSRPIAISSKSDRLSIAGTTAWWSF